MLSESMKAGVLSIQWFFIPTKESLYQARRTPLCKNMYGNFGAAGTGHSIASTLR